MNILLAFQNFSYFTEFELIQGIFYPREGSHYVDAVSLAAKAKRET